MMSEDFKADYFRMTGKKYTGSLTDWFKVFMKHNLKYMWLYRKYSQKPTLLRHYRLYKLSKKYGLEILPKQCGAGLYLGHPFKLRRVELNAVF